MGVGAIETTVADAEFLRFLLILIESLKTDLDNEPMCVCVCVIVIV